MDLACLRLIVSLHNNKKVLIVDPIGGDPLPATVFTSRGHYPSYGSGAYFKVHKNPVLTSREGSLVPGKIEYNSETDPGYSYTEDGAVSYGNYGAWATVNRHGTLQGHLCGMKYLKTSGHTHYQVVQYEHYSYKKDHWEGFTGVKDWLSKMGPSASRLVGKGSSSQGTPLVLYVTNSTPEYKLNEYSAFNSAEDLGIFPHDYAQGFAAAYVEASKGFANAATNSIANMLETLSLLKGMAEGLKNPTKAIKSLVKDYSDPRQAWLAYRYSYTTTKADMKEYAEFFSQAQTLAKFRGESFILGGKYTTHSGIHCYCRIVAKTEDLLPKNLQQWLEKAGFNPNLVNAWDLVPYSFVVDWFLHISDLLEYVENIGASITIAPTEIWYSAKTSYDGQWVYFRVPGRRLDTLPYMEDITVSGKTLKMRIADAISLFT